MTHIFEVHGPDADKQAIEALAERYVKISPVGDLVKVDAVVDKETGEALETGIDALMTRAIPKTDNPDGSQREAGRPARPRRHRDARRRPAGLGSSAAPTRSPSWSPSDWSTAQDRARCGQHGREKPHLNVTMTLDQLAGIDATGGALARFGRIPKATARRLACDAVYTRFITDPHGEVLDVGRASRFTNTALNKAMALMHRTCAYPNCTVPLRRCEIHHVIWWSNGGGTILENLVPLCKQHHRFAHEHGYTIEQARRPRHRQQAHRATTVALQRPPRPTHPRPPPNHARRYVEQLTPPM